MYQAPGTPRIRLLNVAGTPVLYLPMPNKGLPTMEWVEKGQIKELFDGSEANRRLGWIPQLTLRWSVYLDQIQASFTEGVTPGAWGLVIGTANGQMPSMADLLTILSGAPGSISISPGPSAGGFVAQSWKIKPIGVNPLGQADGVEIVFRGGAIQSSMALGGF